MGYRSQGMLYLSDIVEIPDDVKETLSEWDTITKTDTGTIYEFEYWKWHSQFPEVRLINDFVASLANEYDETDYDFVVVGEDNAIILHATQSKFGVCMMITVN